MSVIRTNHHVKPSSLAVEPEIWDGRWQALNQNIYRLIACLEARDKQDWEITVESTLKCLRAFGKKQFQFFNEGFQSDFLMDSPQYKAEYALRQTLDQIAFDLAVLQRIHSQRNSDPCNDVARETLELADKLAYRALQPAMVAGLIPPTTVLTYFQKATHVRVIPYAPIAFIGIPYTCTGIFDNEEVYLDTSAGSGCTARDFLAIAHEAGHYVFWHGKKGKAPLRSLLRSHLSAEPAWRMGWLEEVFADVYGALIAGPVLALDFQELVYDNPNLDEDDGDHPVGAIRPCIYIDTLDRIQGKNGKLYPKSPQALSDKWEAATKKRIKISHFRPKKGSMDGTVSLDKAREHLHEAIELILELLQPVQTAQQDKAWSLDNDDPNTTLYQTFREEILNELSDTPPIFQSRPPESDLNDIIANTDDNTIEWTEGKPLVKWFSFFTEAPDDLTLLPETWSTLLEGGGWAAGGPESDGNPK